MTTNGQAKKGLLREFLTNPHATLTTIAERTGVRHDDALQTIARAALNKEYQAFGLVTAHNEMLRTKVFAFLANGGGMKACTREFGVSAATIQKWLRPLELMVEPQQPIEAGLVHPRAQEALVDAAVRSIERESKIRDSLAGRRLALARMLYRKVPGLWKRAEELAQAPQIPAAALRAVVEAAHTALKDAQLLAGEATDRTEGLLVQIGRMTTEELRVFVHGPMGAPAIGTGGGGEAAPAAGLGAHGAPALPG